MSNFHGWVKGPGARVQASFVQHPHAPSAGDFQGSTLMSASAYITFGLGAKERCVKPRIAGTHNSVHLVICIRRRTHRVSEGSCFCCTMLYPIGFSSMGVTCWLDRRPIRGPLRMGGLIHRVGTQRIHETPWVFPGSNGPGGKRFRFLGVKSRLFTPTW